MQQRYYDPAIGRLLSADPMAVETKAAWNFNRYSYASNNPYRFTDPDGRQSVGELLHEQTEQTFQETGGGAKAFGMLFVETAWNYLGAEGLSQVLDKGKDAGTGNYARAVMEVAALGAASHAAEKLATVSGSLTGHASDQAAKRGVTMEGIKDALANPLKTKDVKIDQFGRPSYQVVGATVTAVVNPLTQQVVSVWKTSARVAKKLLKEAE